MLTLSVCEQSSCTFWTAVEHSDAKTTSQIQCLIHVPASFLDLTMQGTAHAASIFLYSPLAQCSAAVYGVSSFIWLSKVAKPG